MVKVNYIYEFVTLAETLSFSKTADICFIAQPALSKHITELEESMGGKLFQRNTRQVSLTPAGKAVLGSFQNIIREYDAAHERTSMLSAGKSGFLRISSPYYWTEDFTEPIVEQFINSHPSCHIELLSCQPPEGIRDIKEKKSDVLIFQMSGNYDNSIRRVPFAKEIYSVACMKNHPLAKYDSLRLEQVQGYQMVFVGAETDNDDNYATFSSTIQQLLGRRGIYLQDIMYTQQIDTLGMTLKKTGRISIMPYGMRHMDRSYLRFIPLVDEDCHGVMCIYYLAENTNPFIPLFLDEAAKQEYLWN